MNEFKRYNVAGISFAMETDAHEALNQYLESLRKAYEGNAGRDEIIADIEGRIAELILSAQSSQDQVIARPLVENIIRQMGSADDISGGKPEHKPGASIPRRLYRDGDNVKIGGVCSGVAKYFNIDAAIVRICFFIPLLLAIFLPKWYGIDNFCGNIFIAEIILYLLMWFAVPKAITARQKLEMNGEPITSASIAGYEPQSEEERARNSVARFVSVLGFVGMVILKSVVVLLLFPLAFSIIAMIAVGIAVLIGASFFIPGLPEISASIGTFIPILGITSVVIPICAVCYLFLALLFSYKPKSYILGILFGLWVVVVVLLAVRVTRLSAGDIDIDISNIIKKSVTEQVEESLGEIDDSIQEMTGADSLQYMEAVKALNAPSIDE